MFLLVLVVAGCASILEDDRISETPHSGVQHDRQPEEHVEVSNYDELKAEMLNCVIQHEGTARMRAYSYDGDIALDIRRARFEIMNIDPIGAYAVFEIGGESTRIVSYYEINVSIEYKRTKQQIDSIVNVSTLRYLRTELLKAISECSDEAVIRTSLNITEEEIIGFIRETYYENPRKAVMLPITVVDVYPVSGNDRVFELRFGYIERAGILRHRSENLALHVRRNVEIAVGENDAEILISLAENLMAACLYDEGVARALSVHGSQNFAATAYGALANGSAVGEGFAMAFKALCDELGFDCEVVLGYYDGMIHAWNIITLDGEYYHIDVSMCSVYGIEAAFLKTDEDFIERYTWDMENTKRCNGTLTYEDIVEMGEDDEIEDDEDLGDETGESSEQPGDGVVEPPDGSGGETEERPAEPGNTTDET